MSDESPQPEIERPPPICAVLGILIPILSVNVPFCVGISDDDSGSFRSIIAMGYAFYGGIFGIAFGIMFGLVARSRRERNALTAALATLVVAPVLLVIAFMVYSTSG
jgi:hypothetical protein